MRTFLVRSTLAALLATPVLAAGASPAAAERWRTTDATGDVVSRSSVPQPGPCATPISTADPSDAGADITSLAVRHRRSTVELRAAFRDLRGGGQQTVEFDVKTDRRELIVFVSRRRTGALPRVEVARSLGTTHQDECGSTSYGVARVRCTGTEADMSPEDDVVSLVVPRQCLRDPRWVRVGVGTTRFAGRSHSTDAWARPGTDTAVPAGPFGPYGPRVRRG